MKRISVAVLAPKWNTGGDDIVVGILNKKLWRGKKKAAAFGGALTLTTAELNYLATLGATVEREGSTDARLNLNEDALPEVLDWFRKLSPERLLPEILREIREEALEGGEPVFNAGAFDELRLEYVGAEVPELAADASNSPTAEAVPTTYLWFYFRVHSSASVLEQMKRSERIVFPTGDEITAGSCGDIVLAPNLK